MQVRDLKRTITSLRNNLNELQNQIDSSTNLNDNGEPVIGAEEEPSSLLDDPQAKRVQVSSLVVPLETAEISTSENTSQNQGEDMFILSFVPVFATSPVSQFETATGKIRFYF
jgi:hypothetical protein